VLGAWTLAGGITLGDSGVFRSCDLAGGSRSVGAGPLEYLVPGPSLPLSLLLIHMRQSCDLCRMVLPP
jgi:hypothetical protein